MKAKTTPREAGAVSESEAKKNWRKENTVMIAIRLQKKTDADILSYLDGKQNQTEIKRALRLLIETENKKSAE